LGTKAQVKLSERKEVNKQTEVSLGTREERRILNKSARLPGRAILLDYLHGRSELLEKPLGSVVEFEMRLPDTSTLATEVTVVCAAIAAVAENVRSHPPGKHIE